MAHQENNAIAEGQAEYYAAYELMDINPANLAWPVPFEGKRDWNQRMVENMEMMNSDSPGKQARSRRDLGARSPAAVPAPSHL